MLFLVITQQVEVISYRRFGTTCQSHPQGSRKKIKSVGPTRCSSREECGRWKQSIACCQPIGLLCLGLEGSFEVSAVRERETERDAPPSFCFLLLCILLVVTYFFFVLFISLLPLSLCPYPLRLLSLRCNQLCTRYIYHAVALDYDLPLLILCNWWSVS